MKKFDAATLAFKRKWAIFLALSAIVVGITHASAQITIVKAVDHPTNPEPYTWHLSTRNQSLALWIDSTWIPIYPEAILDLEVCNELVVVEFDYVDTDTKYVILDQYGKLVYGGASQFYCGEAILGLSNGYTNSFYGNDCKAQALQKCKVTADFLETCSPFRQVKLQGEVAFCAPGPLAIRECEEFRNWGMFTSKGQWIIDPKFDAPFHFQNGTADVIYYGQRRKINEKGEFVE